MISNLDHEAYDTFVLHEMIETGIAVPTRGPQ
jgi:hypothetical protein